MLSQQYIWYCTKRQLTVLHTELPEGQPQEVGKVT